MKVKIKKEIFFENLKNAIAFTNKSHKIPTISNVLIEASNGKLILTGTDLITEGIIEINECEILEEGYFLTNTTKLFNIIKLFSNEYIEFTSNNSKITLKDIEATYELLLLDSEEFTKFDFNKNELNKIKLKTKKFLKGINETIFSINPLNYRAYLTGINIRSINKNKIQFIGSDNYRISFSTITIDDDNEIFNEIDIILPKKSAQHIKRLLTQYSEEFIEFYFNEKFFSIKINNTTINSKLIDEKYPDTTPILELEYPYSIKVHREKFLKALKRASIFHSETEGYTIIEINENSLNIFSQDSLYGKSFHKLEIEQSPKNFKIAINPKYILDLEQILIGENIILNLIDNEEKILITDELNKDFKYYVVPYQTIEEEE